MATILRPTKVGGTRLYTTEVQNGFDLIREDEVDHDLNVVYGEFNGGIDNDNVLVPPHTGPRIVYSKLDLFHSIVLSDLAPGIQLPPGSFAPGAIDTPDLKPDATTQFFAQVGTTLTLPYPILDTTEQTIATITTSPASRGGLIFILGMFSGWWAAPPVPEASFWARLRIGGVQTAISEVVGAQTGANTQVPFQTTCFSLPRGTAGSTGPIILTAQLSVAGGPFIGTVAQIRTAQLVAFELA